MPRVNHVKKARKDTPVCKRGESYYWWKFRHGGKRFSLTYPKQSQLTQSPYLSVIYDCSDKWGEIEDPTSIDTDDMTQEQIAGRLEDVANTMESVAENLRELIDRYEESASNMEEYFSGAEKVDQLRESGAACEQTCDDIDNMVQEVRDAASEVESYEKPDKADFDDEDQWRDQIKDDLQSFIDGITFDEPDFDFHEVG
jgi:hypothetical protein